MSLSVRATLSHTVALLALVFAVGCAPSATPTAVSSVSRPEPTAVGKLLGPSPALPIATVTISLPPTASPTSRPTGSRAVPPRVGAEAFDFTLPDLAGDSVTLSDLRGKKVLLNFWATWCGPCRAEVPLLVRLNETYSHNDLAILAVNMMEDTIRVERFAADYGMSFPILLDSRGGISSSYFVRGIPTTILLDDQGVIRTVHVGMLTERVLDGYVQDLMR